MEKRREYIIEKEERLARLEERRNGEEIHAERAALDSVASG